MFLPEIWAELLSWNKNSSEAVENISWKGQKMKLAKNFLSKKLKFTWTALQKIGAFELEAQNSSLKTRASKLEP